MSTSNRPDCGDVLRISARFEGANRNVHLIGLGAVRSLEQRLATHFGLQYAVTTSSATTALLGLSLAMRLRDSEFITTPYTYGGTMASWMLMGNRAVFADVDPRTMTLAASSVRARMTRRTKAILAADADGVPCDMAALRRTADDAGVPLIVDGAQSFGARLDGRPAGCLADAVVVSFTIGKTLCAGEGGAIVTDNRELYEQLIWWTQHPMRQQRELGLHKTNQFGINGRIHPVAAAIADADFDAALAATERRQREALGVVAMLNGTELIESLPFSWDGIRPSFFRLTAAWRGAARFSELEQRLKTRAVPAHFDDERVMPTYRQPAFQALYGLGASRVVLPHIERQLRRRFRVLLGCPLTAAADTSAHQSLVDESVARDYLPATRAVRPVPCALSLRAGG